MNSTELTSGWTLQANGGDPRAACRDDIPADGPGQHACRPARRRSDPRPVPGRQRVRAALAVRRRLAATARRSTRHLDLSAPGPDERVDLVFEGIDTVATIASLGDDRARPDGEHAPDVPLRRLPSCSTARPSTSPSTWHSATTYAEAEKDAARRPAGAVPHAVQLPPQDGLQLRLGLGPGPADRRAVEAGPAGALEDRPAGIGPTAGHRRRRTAPAGSSCTSTLERTGPRAGLTPRRRDRPRRRTLELVSPERDRRRAPSWRCPTRALWWPAGYGEQPLYDLTLTLAARRPDDAGARPLAAPDRLPHRRLWTRRDDEFGAAFTFSDQRPPVFVKGANWIPDDHFLTRITPARLARRLDQAVDANLNLLRVWGGGIYETDDVLRRLRRAGSAGLAGLPARLRRLPGGAAAVRAEIEAEARENVVRLMPHPSLIHWNGGNENLWGLRGLGLAGAAARAARWGERYCPRAAAGDRRGAGPDPDVQRQQPVLPRLLSGRAAPERSRPRQPPSVGGLEPDRLHRVPQRDPAVLLGVRLPGPAGLAHADRLGARGRRRPARRRRRPEGGRELPGPPEGRRRQRQAGPRHGARTSECPPTSPTGTGPGSSTRRAR